MQTKYNDDQYDFTYPDGIEYSYWNVARNKTIFSTLKKYNINNIIDIGCGRGIVTTHLYEHGLKVTGVELGEAKPIHKTDCNIYYNTNAVDLPKGLRDSVRALSFFDVLEHIEDPKSFITSIANRYENHEYIVATVPAQNELWSNYDDFYGHYRRYDLAMTKKLFEDLNYEILENRYFFHALYMFIRLHNLIKKDRELKQVSPTGFAKTLQVFMGSLFYMEKFLLPGVIPGSSILCVAKKK